MKFRAVRRLYMQYCATFSVATALLLAGCKHSAPIRQETAVAPRAGDREIAAGVWYRRVAEGSALSPASDVFLVDADLSSDGARAEVCAGDGQVDGGKFLAQSQPVRDWCASKGAVAAINGGFFGITRGPRKEVLGLLATQGEIVSSGRLVRSPNHADRRLVRCVLAFSAAGLPHIGWAVGERGRSALLTEYTRPLNPASQRYWSAASAVACGPRLIEHGRVHVTDREERLVSPPRLPRTFVGYSEAGGRPSRMVLAVGEAMTFEDAAGFLQRYFRQYHACSCSEAMCLDGGGSSQLVIRSSAGPQTVYGVPVAVPTAVLLFARAASERAE